MERHEVFKRDYVFIKENLSSIDDAFAFIAKKAKALKIATSEDNLIKSLKQRELELSTGIEKGFAIPHCQSDAIEKPSLFFIKTNDSINWKTFDNSKVKYMFVILIPNNNKEALHMDILAKVSTILLDLDKVEKLTQSDSADEIYEIISDYLMNKNLDNSHILSGKKVIGITSCAVGIAHTYLSAETLNNTLKQLGYSPKIETRGSVGILNKLTQTDIAEAEFVIIASDVQIPLDDFGGKKVYITSTKEAIHNPKEVIQKAKNANIYQVTKVKTTSTTQTQQGLLRHIINGISYMIPYVIFGGIMIAISLGFGKSIYGNNAAAPKGDFLWWILEIGVVSFTLMIGALGAYIAYSIAGRAALMPAFVVSFIANKSDLFFNIGGISAVTPMGFIGSILFGLLIGYTVKWITNFKIQKSVSALIPMFIIPIGVTLFYSLLVIFVVGAPIGWVMDKFIAALQSIFTTKSNLGIGIAFLLGILLGAMAGFDMGGPINKVAFLTSTALVSQKIFQPMGMVGAAIPVAPLGMGLATLIFRKKFSNNEKSLGLSAILMGFIGISEGAIPFAVADPKRVIVANVVGSSVAGGIAGALSVSNAAAHGGPIVAILGAVGSQTHGTGLGILFFFISIIVGTTITALIYGFWKDKNIKKSSKLAIILEKINFFKRGKNDSKKAF
ncbi:fructose-specific PTS transporter subunit EIIC [Mycoplasmopsis citelli]|uniref:PTS system protein n=1 Tax=Mycoplasmopsis citelli TaxID=171281 RepID=A0A449B384_9BACT|nr:fructose-specific PTS transporter subunit EIIC [Mycoplasmopsis citelli]UUD36358.1 fructose-specific PTS transporter subunit EIIC [Mycoplasmopsis citelli]VEU75058.1 PTS system protein [Mycoplasmopsis citelli]